MFCLDLSTDPIKYPYQASISGQELMSTGPRGKHIAFYKGEHLIGDCFQF